MSRSTRLVYNSFLPCVSNSDGQYQEGRRNRSTCHPHNRRIVRQQQAEMNPPNPPLAGTEPVVAAQMQMLQQMANTMMDMQAQMRQEHQEMRWERQEMREEMRQEWMVRQQQAPMPPPPPPPVPPGTSTRSS